jgi:ketosteroid isomerase-like protein
VRAPQVRLYYPVPMDREYSARFLETTGSAATEKVTAPETVLHKAFDAIIHGDFDVFGQWVTDDVVLSINGFGAMDGTWRGRDEVVAASQRNFEMLVEEKPEIEAMISQGNSIALLLRDHGVLKSSGQAYSVRGVQWFTFVDGKISKIEEFLGGSIN